MASVETRSILVSLDSLVDIRQGTLLLINEDIAAEITLDAKYYRRTRDDFQTSKGPLKRDDLQMLLRRRPKDILKLSLYTRMHEFLNELITRYQVMAATTPGFEAVTLHVNAYPFILTDEEKLGILKALDQHLGGCPIPMEMVYLSPKDLNMTRIHSTYTALIMYEWIEWLQAQGQAPATKPARDIAFYFPRLQHGVDPSEQQRSRMNKMGTDAFDALMRVVLQPIMGAQWAPMRYYCATSPLNLPRSSLDD